MWVGCTVQAGWRRAGTWDPVTSHLARRLHILWLLLSQPDEHEWDKTGGALSIMAMVAEGKKKDKAL